MMGNYKEPELQQVKPLREVDSSQIRLHTFGNPFKLKQQDQVCFPFFIFLSYPE